jgi:hypothetical protein
MRAFRLAVFLRKVLQLKKNTSKRGKIGVMKGREREEKLERWLYIKATLTKHPTKSTEIQKQVREKFHKTNRLIQYDLSDMEKLGIIKLDEQKGLYYLPGPKLLTPKDYEFALEHSRMLLFTQTLRQGFNNISQDKWVNTLLNADRYVDSKELGCLMQHLKTGYYEELWLLLEEYSKLKGIAKQSSEKMKDRLIELEQNIIDTFSDIMMEVEHGNILRGSCKICENRRMSVTNKLMNASDALGDPIGA